MNDHIHPRLDRVALVCSLGAEPKGSGYLVDPHHVLTADHVVRGLDRVLVRFCGETKHRAATVAWRGRDKDGLGKVDVAFLRLDAAAEGDRGLDPEWASFGRSDLPCEAVGYPIFQDESRRDGTGKKDVDTERFKGQLEPLAGAEHGRINAKHTTIARPNSNWKGISGAGLFMQGLLVGVVTEADTDRLRGWPVASLVEDQSLANARKDAPPLKLRRDALWTEADQPLVQSLRSREARISNALQPTKLLEASYGIVKFEEQGRSVALALLDDFVAESARDGVLVIVGPGGTGKSRLMLEWCHRMRARQWLSGFVQRGEDLPESLVPLVLGDTPALVVIDYAETDPVTTRKLLRAMIHRQRGPTLRIVLLAREAGPWFRALSKDDEVVGECLALHPVHELANLYGSAEARARGFSMARAQFAEALGVARAAGDQEDSVLLLDSAVEDRALYVHMQALLAAYGEPEAAEGRLSHKQVLNRVLDHEQRFWTRWFETHGREAIPSMLREGAEQVAAALVLCGRAPDRTAARALFDEAAPDLEASERHALVECFAELYEEGPNEKGIVPIEPDLLGETLLARVIERDTREEGGLERWLGLAFSSQAPSGSVARALTVLSRLASRAETRESGRLWMEQLLRDRGRQLVSCIEKGANQGQLDLPGAALEQAIGTIEDRETAEEIANAVPRETVELREVRATALRVAIDAECRGNHPDRGRLGRLWTNLSIALSELGKRHDALRAAKKSVHAYQELNRQHNNGIFLPKVASALSNLGQRLHDLGKGGEALQATQSGVEIRRGLVGHTPSRELAGDLINHAISLRGIGNHDESLRATQEAFEIFRRLEEQHPNDFLADLALSYTAVATDLNSLGRKDESIRAMQAAVEIYRKLAEQRRDAFLPHLALSLNNLSVCLDVMGRHDEGVQAALAAIEIRRELANHRPIVFLPDLAASLTNLGACLHSSKKHEDAILAAQDAIEILRKLAEQQPTVFLPKLATTLGLLGAACLAAGHYKDALGALSEALRRILPSMTRLPRVYGPLFRKIAENLRRAAKQGGLPIPEDLAGLPLMNPPPFPLEEP